MKRAKVAIDPLNRHEQLVRWVECWCDGVAFTLHPLTGGASARNFFRLELADGRPTLIVRDSPAHGDSHRFARVARLLADGGVHAPNVIAQDLERGFLLISDLGDTSYLSALNRDNANSLFEAATNALIRWQLASRPGVLPSVDEALLRREMDLFAEWYVERHLGMMLGPDERRSFEDVVAAIVARNLSQPTVYVHRDYTARNLMVCDLIPGVLDFQDAMLGPVTYDVASLFWTSSHDWPEERVRNWTFRYWEKAGSAGVPVQDRIDEFRDDLQWTSVQRHLKVLGVFARLNYRDGKPQYLENSPRLVRRIRAVAVRYDALAPLLEILDRRGDATLN